MGSGVRANAPYYFVPQPSKWPILGGLALAFFGFGLASWFNGAAFGPYLFAVFVLLMAYVLIGWISEVARESERGLYSDRVDVSFEHGDTDYPVWEFEDPANRHPDAAHGYIGKYRAVVLDNDDPMGEHRLQVTVPDVDPAPAWASSAVDDVDDFARPQVGDEVWIEYDGGDVSHPRWVGRV